MSKGRDITTVAFYGTSLVDYLALERDVESWVMAHDAE